MSLDAGRVRSDEVPAAYAKELLSAIEKVYSRWARWEPSPLSHHGRSCCETAREWIVATDFGALNGGGVLSGPRWLRQRFEWGPSRYPIYWCELPDKQKIDCGVLAALSHEIFTSRGVRSFRAQLVQEFTADAATQWRCEWECENAVTEWISDTLIYHEGVAVQMPAGKVKLWDSSAGWWSDPRSINGYGATRAVRISAGADRSFKWGDHDIPAGTWTVLSHPALSENNE